MKVLQFPLARITIGFVLGILSAYYCNPIPELVFGSLLVAFVSLCFCYFWSVKKTYNSLFFGINTAFLSFCIGATALIVHTDSFQKSNYIHNTSLFEKDHLIRVTIREKLKNSVTNYRYIALIEQVNQQKQTGKIVLNIRKDSLNLPFEIGTNLQIKGTLYPNNPPNNPNQFDYSKYLANKQIYAQIYANADAIQKGSKLEKDIWYYTARLRTKIIRNLEKNHFHKTELDVAVALILGQQQDISPEIIRDYQYAGAVHILSVSGLHIGFILMFLTAVLKPIPNTRKGSFIKLLLILISLWLFGILAGLAPSVVRSVTMFSFVAIGNHLRRSVNIYHTLLVSILLILLFQPTFLFDVGFQLSYVALFFIVWLQPLLAGIWIPKNKVLTYIWDIITVTFAAQIGTFPLSIYYFHQFPGLFFATNLVVIPLLSLIMILGVVVMLLAALNCVPYFLSKALEWSIFYLNKIINTIASLEQFIIHDIAFNWYFMMSFYLLIVSCILWFKKPSFNKLIGVGIAIIITQIVVLENQWKIQNEHEWIVFNAKKTTLITERKGKQVTVFAADNVLKTASKNNVLTTYLVGNYSTLTAKKKLGNIAYFKGEKILIVDSLCSFPKDISPDILVLTQSARLNLERVLHTMKPKMVVADGSNFKSLLKIWKATCQQQKIPFHATAEKGFYRLQ
ncbi:ComEC/Rec2 family competence protein [Flavobacterium restrictum]|uniref:ComEC family competence protein n=1 Tax=Flavobacterium restrictum TaxID=2594428 RepID=A0A553DWD8_9FLAO|nr:ComEC/Rec2 family competence protein [Flavobacterium restrictum]TRX37087.1 ComEC family competence protein [Flavobacterium restrictum]